MVICDCSPGSPGIVKSQAFLHPGSPGIVKSQAFLQSGSPGIVKSQAFLQFGSPGIVKSQAFLHPGSPGIVKSQACPPDLSIRRERGQPARLGVNRLAWGSTGSPEIVKSQACPPDLSIRRERLLTFAWDWQIPGMSAGFVNPAGAAADFHSGSPGIDKSQACPPDLSIRRERGLTAHLITVLTDNWHKRGLFGTNTFKYRIWKHCRC